MYRDLKKIYHADSRVKAVEVYDARFNDSSAFIVGLRDKDPFFFWMAPEVYKSLLDIERLDKQVEQLVSTIPQTAINHYLKECLIDEIILTNEVEGVVSTRKQLEAALDALQRNDKRKRFQGIVKKYYELMEPQRTSLRTCEDLRALYDELVLEEIIEADLKKAPDESLFRKDSVRVVDAADRIIHENNFSEDRIDSELAKQLQFLNEAAIEPAVRAAVFHFAFGYVHPFYDGNGRTNRFISSSVLANEVSRFAGMRLSFSVKEHINDYYKAFSLVEHPLNKGDLTPFVLTFLEIAADSLRKTIEALTEKRDALEQARLDLAARFATDSSLDLDKVGGALLEGDLFTSSGLTAKTIAKDVGLSAPTVHKRLDEFKRTGLLKRTSSGRHVYYCLDISQL